MSQENSPQTLTFGGNSVRIASLARLAERAGIALGDIPFVGRVLIESLLRAGNEEQALTLAQRLAAGEDAAMEIPFLPARVLVQDYTGIPLLVDLAAMREALGAQGGAPLQVNPAIPTDVIVDHSIQADTAGTADALARNEALEFQRNRERYAFLKWAEQSFANLRVVPPGRGIVHQVNLEQLATLVTLREDDEGLVAFPDTVIGTDSHTTMVNGLGVLGWGVGGLEAESIMLGLAAPMSIPPIIGVVLSGVQRPGVMATDVVLSLTAHLRAAGVTGALLEFSGPGVAALAAPDRCTIANMAPEYGAMAAFFPVDMETLRYLRQTGRRDEVVRLAEEYCRAQGLLRAPDAAPRFKRTIHFDLSSVEATLAGPSQPHQRVTGSGLPASFAALTPAPRQSSDGRLRDGDIVIAAITSCTNTSNPKAMLAAALLAQRAVARGMTVPRHVKTSLSPGSQAVTRYLAAAGLLPALEALGFHVVGYGCMTCNGGSGPLAPEIAEAITRDQLTVCAVLSGNRNFEGRIHSQVRAGYLASPALVVALALAGHVRGNFAAEPLGTDRDGAPVFLADLWPTDGELAALESRYVLPQVFQAADDDPEAWRAIATAGGDLYCWDPGSTYIQPPPYLDAQLARQNVLGRGDTVSGARVLAALGDCVSTDHISPVGLIPADSPAGDYLRARGVESAALNSYGSRRGNHEVMARGTFANLRLRNHLLPGVEGGYTRHFPSGEQMTIFDAAARYAASATPLIILAGESYGMGSSRDWAAKGPWLLGVRAVLAESFERIHRANLCAMGILPLLLPAGQSWAALGLTGSEPFGFSGIEHMRQTGQLQVSAARDDGTAVTFASRTDLRSQGEWDMIEQGGMLPSLLRSLTS